MHQGGGLFILDMLAYPSINPVIFNVYGPISLNWYGLSYAVGVFLCSYLSSKSLQNYFNIKIKYDEIASYGIIGIIIGGRLFYVLFYDLEHYIQNPNEIVAIWLGGMSFHGGLFGLFASMVALSKKFKINLTKICDVLVIYGPIGLLFGRIANFINGELFGRVDDCRFCMIFPNDPLQLPRHPSQIYEALAEGLLLFLVMIIVNKRFRSYKKPLFNTGLFLILYSSFRIVIENFRQPDEQIGLFFEFITMGQLLCFVQLLLGLFLITKSHRISNEN